MSAITVRHAEQFDAAAIHAIYVGEQAFGSTLQLPYPSLRTWEQRLAEPKESFYNLVAELDGEVVGQLSFEHFIRPRRRHAGTFGMGVRADSLRQGVGRALMDAMIELADNWLNLKRIEMEVYVDNEAAIALYKSFNFVIEGESKDFAFRNGELVDVYQMARIRS
ncbi:GNAT family N-acetyltransferase [Saccharospirillum sp. HFRX-1]|uniref:GNAT family N-acetyltransferase n=1 Tax=unclassified Saccharospirillum TaxID=2633430 RepID=UPI003718E870